MGGMKVGSKHKWYYKTLASRELGNNRFVQYQSKGRNISSPRGSGMPLKSKLRWAIKGEFYTKKIGKNKWVRVTTGYKGQAGFKTPKMKKMRYTKRRTKRRRY